MRVLLTALVILMAGCASSSSSSSSTDHDVTSHAQMVGFPLPTWRVGNGWVWDSPQIGTYTYVVSAADATTYTMDTDNAGVAFFDARGDISTLGTIRASDLAGSQGATAVEFFKFPLKANMTWSTTWDGLTVSVRVVSMDAETAKLEARRSDDVLHAAYTFDNRTGYFGELNFYDQNGTLSFGSKVTSHVPNFSGDLIRYSLTELADYASDLKGAASTTYTVGPAFTDVWMSLTVSCQTGAYAIGIGPPTGYADNRGISSQGACPAAFQGTATQAAPPQDEVWGVVIAGNPANDGSARAIVLGRVATTFAPGSAP